MTEEYVQLSMLNQEDANTTQDMLQSYREWEEEKYPDSDPFTTAQHRVFDMFDVVSIRNSKRDK